MKSNSDVRPDAIRLLGNGAYHYNYNIVERVEVVEATPGEDGNTTMDTAPQERTTYDFDTVEAWGRPDYKELTRAVIRSEVSETEEFGLINDFNAAGFGILEDSEKEEAESRYRVYLNRVGEIKAMVRADLTAAGY